MTPEELAELLASLTTEGAVSALSDEDLAAHEANLLDAVDPAAQAADVETLTSIQSAVTAIRTESSARAEAAAERAAQVAELVEAIRPPVVEETPPEGDETIDETAVTEPDPTTVTEGEAPPEAPAEATAPAEVEAAQPIAAAALPHSTPVTQIRPVGAPPSLGRAQRRAGAAHRPAPRQTSQFSITAAAGPGGFAGGQPITVDQLDEAIVAAALSFGAPASQPTPRTRVASVHTHIDPARRLSDTDGRANEERLRSLDVVTASGLTAAGGPCAAPMVDYSQNPIGSADRVLPGALTHVQGTRGAVSYMQPPKIGDFAAGVSAWTQTTDASDGALAGTTTKPCVRITCGDYVTARTEAIVICATIGNWIARNYDERVSAMRQLLNVEASRFVEARHLSVIGAGSLHIPKTHVLGAARDVLTRIDLTLAQARDQYRMGDNDLIEVMAPRWLQDMMQADVARELPGSAAERLATSDAEIAQWFAARNVNPTWLMDAEAGATFPAAANNVATRWPTQASLYVFPAGSWKFLDDGLLNLSVSGPYHDSVLNKTNDAQLWWETFENVYFQGTWSKRLDLELCPSGTTSATTAVTCLTGS